MAFACGRGGRFLFLLGWLASSAWAATPVSGAPPLLAGSAGPRDIALDAEGHVRGQWLDPQGRPPAGGSVALLRDGVLLASAPLDRTGRFRLPTPGGGVYQLVAGEEHFPLRAWQAAAAPPHAAGELLVVSGTAVRGACTAVDALFCDPLLITAVVAAAVAVPLAAQRDRDRPAGSW